MEIQSHYRLERWIALLLSLLFFLPFVARADDLIATGSFHGGEIAHASGESFLALIEQRDGSFMLQPAQIRVTRENDAIVDEPHEQTGVRVETPGVDDAFLLRGKRLVAGPVQPASVSSADLPLHQTTTLTFNGRAYSFRYHCATVAAEEGRFDCALVLNGTQELATFPADRDEQGKLQFPDMQPSILFAGDLDHDGSADFLIDVSNHYNLWEPALFLSTAAANGELVRQVAKLSTAGC
jgi:hypothetical protein